MKFYIDEDLTPGLAQTAHLRGFDATSVRDRGREGQPDSAHFELCQNEERVLVTNNTKDFVGRCVEAGLHAGLISMPNHLTRVEQQALFDQVLEAIEAATAETGEATATYMLNRHVIVDDAGVSSMRSFRPHSVAPHASRHDRR